MPRDDFEDLKGPLFKLFGRLPAKSSPTCLLGPLWREAVGPIADQTRLISLDRGVLRVAVDPAFLFDLTQARELVLQRLNARLKPFHEVKALDLKGAILDDVLVNRFRHGGHETRRFK